MNPVILIGQTLELRSILDDLKAARTIAVDTESNSFHAYFERVCLVQISTPEHDYVLDPLTIEDMEPLRAVFEDPEIEKIFHAASNDVLGIKRDYDFKINNLFDTAIACKFLGCTHLGLARVLEDQFGIILNKKWQRHDWSRRPLTAEQLDYARQDTRYLIALRHRLAADLSARDLWECAREAFQKVSDQELQERPFRPEGFIQIKGARGLDSMGRRILKALYLYREQEARRRDRAPFRVLTDDTLLRLAAHRPQSVQDFSKIKGMPRSYLRTQQARSLLELIRRTGCFREEARAH